MFDWGEFVHAIRTDPMLPWLVGGIAFVVVFRRWCRSTLGH